jgi:nitrite reductase (NADH) small subunit
VATWVMVCREEEVPEGGVKGLEVAGLRIALFRDAGVIHALFGRCPHAGGPLDRGWIEQGDAVCPLHRWRFQLTSGRCANVPGQSVHRFACEIREGEVWVAV